MRKWGRALTWAGLLLVVLSTVACDEGGIGIGVPASGARYSGPGPDVMVGGGPRR
jgi:hypothetical protein